MGFFFIVYYGAWPSIFFLFLLNTAHHNQKLNAPILRLHAEPLQLCFGICNQFSIQQFNQFYLLQLYFLFKYSLFEKLLFVFLFKKTKRQPSHLPAVDSLKYLQFISELDIVSASCSTDKKRQPSQLAVVLIKNDNHLSQLQYNKKWIQENTPMV